jgi:hypothetical protein
MSKGNLAELVALAGLAALGCGLALEVGDLWFAAIFGVASAVARRSPLF